MKSPLGPPSLDTFLLEKPWRKFEPALEKNYPTILIMQQVAGFELSSSEKFKEYEQMSLGLFFLKKNTQTN